MDAFSEDSLALIQLQSAQASYQGKTVLSNIDLRVCQGERIALVGRSGAGKSTLLRLIYEQQSVAAALVPQDEGLVLTLSVYHNVYMGKLGQRSWWYNLLNLFRPWHKESARVSEILAILGLQAKLYEPVGRLSGGQRQRTAVARSLFQGGQLLLADEPVSAVDEHQARVVMQALCDSFPTVVLAMHDIRLALAFCDRIVGLREGRIVLDEKSATLDPEDLLPLYKDRGDIQPSTPA